MLWENLKLSSFSFGGLAIIWRKDFNCQIICFSQNFIDLRVEDSNGKWRITGFYVLSENHGT